MTREEALDLLLQSADPEYKEFNDRITNCDTAPSIGIRVPRIREIAAQVVRDGWEEYLEQMETQPSVQYQEEHMLWGMVLGKIRMEHRERSGHLDRWVSGILSWSDCDCSVSSFKFMKKDQSFWFDYCCRWLTACGEFEVRFAMVALMQYFISDPWIDRLLELYAVKSDHPPYDCYYVRMAQAWALSVCFVKYRDRTQHLLEAGVLEPWVQNKAIQKCRESCRVSPEDKELLKTLRM